MKYNDLKKIPGLAIIFCCTKLILKLSPLILSVIPVSDPCPHWCSVSMTIIPSDPWIDDLNHCQASVNKLNLCCFEINPLERTFSKVLAAVPGVIQIERQPNEAVLPWHSAECCKMQDVPEASVLFRQIHVRARPSK